MYCMVAPVLLDALALVKDILFLMLVCHHLIQPFASMLASIIDTRFHADNK